MNSEVETDLFQDKSFPMTITESPFMLKISKSTKKNKKYLSKTLSMNRL